MIRPFENYPHDGKHNPARDWVVYSYAQSMKTFNLKVINEEIFWLSNTAISFSLSYAVKYGGWLERTKEKGTYAFITDDEARRREVKA